MSSNLVWEPTERKKSEVSHQLKYALRKRFGEPINVTLQSDDIMYLRGLEDAGLQDAYKLIKAIEKYGEILVVEEYR